MKFFALKISNTDLSETVEKIKRKEKNIVIDQLNQLKDDLKVGSIVFVQLGGDRAPWDKGLIGLAKVVKEPYDEGYDSGRNFKIQISMQVLLNKVIKREEFRYYFDAYDAGGIGPNTKGEQNQAIKSLEEKQVVAIVRVMLENDNTIRDELEDVFSEEMINRIIGPMTRLFEKEISYDEYLNVNNYNSSNENSYKNYLQKELGSNGGITSYLLCLKNDDVIGVVKKYFDDFKWNSFYDIYYPQEIDKYCNFFDENFKNDEFVNKKYIPRGFVQASLRKYKNYLLSKTFNIIFYGVPGVGKSYKIKSESKGFEQEKTVFHPEYTNADFVGQLLPVNEDGKGVQYKFIPGPFTRLLSKALSNTDKNYLLVIDEINRGNAAAIFGEIFQLLDRDESGQSEFGISNKEVYDYLVKEAGVDKSFLPDEKIYIPSNLYIWATMNTSDQNVYTLDTAFQRRWQMEMLTIDFDKDDETKAQGDIKIQKSKNELTWREFVTAINEEISNRNEGMISVEDKRIGPWFAKRNEIEDISLFTQKVIKYLLDDAFKMSRTDVFKDIKTLDEIVNKIERGDYIEDIFEKNMFLKALNNRKDNPKEEKEDNDNQVNENEE